MSERHPGASTDPAADGPRPDAAEACQLYRLYDAAGKLLYVGISLSAPSRFGQHRDKPWHQQVATMTVETLPDRGAAVAAEIAAIKAERPLFNLAHAEWEAKAAGAGDAVSHTRAAKDAREARRVRLGADHRDRDKDELSSLGVIFDEWTSLGRMLRGNSMVAELGPNTGIYFNLAFGTQVRTTRLIEATQRLYPFAIMGGRRAIHAAGWLTKEPMISDIMIPAGSPKHDVYQVALHPRSKAWYEAALKWIAPGGASLEVYLQPAFALADAVKSAIWRPRRDTLEWDKVDLPELERAFAKLRVPFPDSWAGPIAEIRGDATPSPW